ALDDAINAITKGDRERVAAAIKQALNFSSGGIYNIDYTIVHPVSGKTTKVRAKGRAWFNEEETPYRFNGTLEDITEQTVAIY
ncbi:MAG TPA: PAS domain-containing protein, partial [Ferruginibacter sp.]|nr:PAS domain-containing protein [Ferruginibacter sp.]